MKAAFVLALAFVSPLAFAESSLDCFMAASAAETAAIERDKGSYQVTATQVVSSSYSSVLDAKAAEDMVRVVYHSTIATPAEVYERVLHACINLSSPEQNIQ